jgi:hypothetical protein
MWSVSCLAIYLLVYLTMLVPTAVSKGKAMAINELEGTRNEAVVT